MKQEKTSLAYETENTSIPKQKKLLATGNTSLSYKTRTLPHRMKQETSSCHMKQETRPYYMEQQAEICSKIIARRAKGKHLFPTDRYRDHAYVV